MSEEDREVVQYFTQFIPFMWWKQPDENGRLKIDVDLLHKIETILNLVQKQRDKIEQLESNNKKLIEKLEKDNKKAKQGFETTLSSYEHGIMNYTQEILEIVKGEKE